MQNVKRSRRRRRRGGKRGRTGRGSSYYLRRQQRRRLLAISRRNDLLLTVRYRTQLREEALASYRQRAEDIRGALEEIVELKSAREECLLDLINGNVDGMVGQMMNIAAELEKIFGQYVKPPAIKSVAESKVELRKRMEEIYGTFRQEFYFNLPSLKGRGSSRKVVSSPELSLKSMALDDTATGESFERRREALEKHRDNLLEVLGEEEIRTIAEEQILQERIQEVDDRIQKVQEEIAKYVSRGIADLKLSTSGPKIQSCSPE